MAQRGSYAKGAAKREEILDVALEIIAREGYRRTSVRELAQAVGLSQAGLMHHFSSKDELFIEILRRRDEVDTAWLQDDPEAGMLEKFARVVEHNTQVPGLVQLYVSFAAEAVGPNHIGKQFFIERFERLREELAEEIRQGQLGGKFQPGLNPDSAARTLLALSDGLQARWLLDPGFDMAAHITEVIDSWKLEPHAG